jgi:hypothetical protein
MELNNFGIISLGEILQILKQGSSEIIISKNSSNRDVVYFTDNKLYELVKKIHDGSHNKESAIALAKTLVESPK